MAATANGLRSGDEGPVRKGEDASAGPQKAGWRGHPDLRGGRPPPVHGFDAQQMRALALVCDTFVPSICTAPELKLLPENGVHSDGAGNGKGGSAANNQKQGGKCCDHELDTFYRLSGSDVGLAEEVAGFMVITQKPHIVFVIRWLLWMLSTRVGTFFLFGTASLTWRFPFVESFLNFSPQLRERALLQWASGGKSMFEKLFKLLKGYSTYCFYSKVDSDGHNPSWNAMGYCGADPKAFKTDFQPKPLEGKVLDPESSKEELTTLLTDGGFELLDKAEVARLVSKSSTVNKGRSGKTMGIRCDVVVVGSGSGGGVIAGALARAGRKVLVLEKGRYYARGDLSLLEGPSMKAMYESAGTLMTADGGVALMAGATVGGGSTVNWAASFRTPDYVSREWADAQGLKMFATEEYRAAMDEVCKRGSVGAKFEVEDESFQNRALAEGCTKLGYEVGKIPRNVAGEGRHSCGWCTFGCATGAKQATSETWLVDAVDAGALILANCSAREGLLEKGGSKGRKAVGVAADWSGGASAIDLYVEAAVTVVCCGSLQTPPLLLRSGLTNPQIGRNLRLHPVIMGWGHFPEGRGPAGTSYEGHIMSSVCWAAGNREASGYGAVLEVPIMHPGVCAALTPWLSGEDHKRRMGRYARTSHFIVLARDAGPGGRVRLDGDGQTPNIAYSVADSDQESLIRGLEIGLRVMAAAGAVEVGTQHLGGETFVPERGEEEFREFLGRVRRRGLDGLRTPICSAHQMGSCRMGVAPEDSVVESTGETWEVRDLFLGDASVFPTASGVNPMITVQAIALCTAHNIIRRLETGHLT